MDREVITKSEVRVEEERNKRRGISRRDFLKGLGITGAGLVFFSAGLKHWAQADSYGYFAAGDLSEEQLIEIQRKMLQIRWYDRTVLDGLLTKKWMQDRMTICHPSCGHEAVAVGVCAALNKDDWIAGYHRSHHHALAKGANIKAMAAEICHKATGTNKGFGGSMHIMQKDVGMLGEDGIVGPGGAYGAGAAAGIRARGTKQVAVTFGGDAHLTSPYFQLALHNSRKYKLPFIYVIENNGYQIGWPFTGGEVAEEDYSRKSGPFEAQTYLKSHTQIANAYGVPGVTVDGMSVLAVYSVMKTAVDRARAGEGPTLIEAKCYRYYGHYGPWGAKPGELGEFGTNYRSDREVRAWMARDPIDKHRKTLINWGVLTEAQANKLEAEVKKEITEAFKFAEESPVPKAEDALKNVYVKDQDMGLLPRQLPNCPLY